MISTANNNFQRLILMASCTKTSLQAHIEASFKCGLFNPGCKGGQRSLSLVTFCTVGSGKSSVVQMVSFTNTRSSCNVQPKATSAHSLKDVAPCRHSCNQWHLYLYR